MLAHLCGGDSLSLRSGERAGAGSGRTLGLSYVVVHEAWDPRLRLSGGRTSLCLDRVALFVALGELLVCGIGPLSLAPSIGVVLDTRAFEISDLAVLRSTGLLHMISAGSVVCGAVHLVQVSFSAFNTLISRYRRIVDGCLADGGSACREAYPIFSVNPHSCASARVPLALPGSGFQVV